MIYDYLRKLCVGLGIKLIYTSNKILMLSSQVKNGIPYIRAHKIFKTCPKSIAQVVVDYFVTLEGREKKEAILRAFIKNKLKRDKFTIKVNDKRFRTVVEQSMPKNMKNQDNNVLTEFTIDTIAVKDFWGNDMNYSKDKKLTPKNDDLMELDIIIKPPVT
jgi:RNase H-fold protein (predicted Holliday junction resolvase)